MLKLWFWMQITILCISANLCFGMVIILGCSCGWIVSDPISLCTFIDRQSESHIFTISLARFSPCYEMPVGLPLALSPHFLVEMLFRVCRRLKTYVSNKGHFPNPIPLSVTSPCMSATPREVILSIKTEGINIQVNYGTHAPQWVANCCHKPCVFYTNKRGLAVDPCLPYRHRLTFIFQDTVYCTLLLSMLLHQFFSISLRTFRSQPLLNHGGSVECKSLLYKSGFTYSDNMYNLNQFNTITPENTKAFNMYTVSSDYS